MIWISARERPPPSIKGSVNWQKYITYYRFVYKRQQNLIVIHTNFKKSNNMTILIELYAQCVRFDHSV